MPSSIKFACLAVIISIFFCSPRLKAQTVKTQQVVYITDKIDSFDSLINKFHGKVIYIDFWATWCHPCRMELQDKKAIAAFSSFAAKNNVATLYICLDKNNASWQQFTAANRLNSYHLLATDSLDKELHQRFCYAQSKMAGARKGFFIPRHMIINREGKIADSLARSQGDAAVYKQINNLLRQ